MIRPAGLPLLMIALLAAGLACPAGCGKARKKRTGPLKEWIVGDWARNDDPHVWTFNDRGELSTTGRLPITGTYSVEEPDRVEILISGAGAVTASMMLGIPLDPETRNLHLRMTVQDDEMRPSGLLSDTVFVRR
jgi:hypothetical protein